MTSPQDTAFPKERKLPPPFLVQTHFALYAKHGWSHGKDCLCRVWGFVEDGKRKDEPR